MHSDWVMNSRQKLLFSGALAMMAVLVMAVPATVSVYAVQGPFVVIGPPVDADSLAAVSVDEKQHVAYGSNDDDEEAAGPGVYYKVV